MSETIKKGNKRTRARLMLHFVICCVLAVLLLGGSIYGCVSLHEGSAETKEEAQTMYDAAVKNAHNMMLTRNYKKLTLADKVKYTSQDKWGIMLALGAALFALAFRLSRSVFQKDMTKKYLAAEKLEAFDYLLPFLVGLIIFTIYPIINVVVMSFKENYNYVWDTYARFGFGNYNKVLNDRYFKSAITNTAIYVITVVPISTVLAIILANLLNRKVRGMAIFQTAYFLPMVTAAVATGLAWKFMFNKDFGLINYVLSWFGVDPIGWLTESNMNIWALIIYGIWNILPFTIILMLAGLQNIDPTYYTAAKVDGAKSKRIFFRITVPLLAPTISLVLIINSISCAKMFNELFPLFRGPGTHNNLYTVVYYIYQYAFNAGDSINLGRASAAAIILFLILFVFTMLQLLIQKKWKQN